MNNTRISWEKEVARKYGIDRNRDREFLARVWDREGPFHEFEEFEACVENAWSWYSLREQAEGFEGSTSADVERPSESPGTTYDGRMSHMVHFDEPTRFRLAGFSEYLAKIAACDRRVMRLRKRICGGVTRTLSPEKAFEFLENHSSPEHEKAGRSGAFLWWQDESSCVRRFRVSEDSVLEELHRAATYLDKHFPWAEDQATRFILCGSVPQAATIMGGYTAFANKGVPAHKFDRLRIKLEVEHWMSAEAVREAYCKLREKALSDKQMLAQVSLGRAGLRNMEIFGFVVGQSRVHVVSSEEHLGRLELPPWPDMVKRWNAQLSKDDPRRYTEAKYFKRDFKRAQKAVIGTNNGLPGIPGEPKTREELEELGRAVKKRFSNLTAKSKAE